MQQAKKIIAVVGMAGSGKTEAIGYLEEKFHWPKVYFPESLFEEIKKRGMELNWESEKKMREGLREEQGKGVFAKLALPKIEKFLGQSNVVLVESMYSWEEYRVMRKCFGDMFKVVAVYASPAVRFSRLQNRKIRPMKTFKEFEQRDANEIEAVEKAGPIAVADYMILNQGSLGRLYEQLDEVVEKEGLLGRVSEE